MQVEMTHNTQRHIAEKICFSTDILDPTSLSENPYY